MLLSAAPAGGQVLPDTLGWSVPLDAQPVEAPVISDGLVVFPLRDGKLAAHRLDNGQAQWVVHLSTGFPLAADDERVYVVVGETVQALDTRSGSTLWRVAAPGELTAPLLVHAGWVIVAAAGDLLALRATDGAIIWRSHLGPVEFVPALNGELLVVPITDGRLVALRIQDGAVLWERSLGSAPHTPAAVGNHVYVGTEDKRFMTLDARSGRPEPPWKVGALIKGRAVADERRVYFAAMDNLLWVVDRGDRAILWRKGLEYRPASGPVLLDTVVVVPGFESSLPVFNVQNGDEAGQIPFGASLAQAPVFARDPEGRPIAVGITGSLGGKPMLTLVRAPAYPIIPVEPLKTLPGDPLPADLFVPSGAALPD